jgi:hypothetical protein
MHPEMTIRYKKWGYNEGEQRTGSVAIWFVNKSKNYKSLFHRMGFKTALTWIRQE